MSIGGCAVLVLVVAMTDALHAQERDGVMSDLIRDLASVETKILGLAKTMPQTAYDWRPAVPPAKFSSTSPATTTFCPR